MSLLYAHMIYLSLKSHDFFFQITGFINNQLHHSKAHFCKYS